ncbi:MAG: DUF3613 domain-containing protein [Oceanococcus sp.]
MSALCLGFTANAAESPSVGERTQQWLDLHKSGAQASTEERPLDGDVAKRNYQRYLKSFESDVPEEFETGVSVE